MEKEDLADDLLKGVDAIANYTGLTKRAVYGLAEKGRLPVFKLDGWKWWTHKFAAVEMWHDRDRDVVYLVKTWAVREQTPIEQPSRPNAHVRRHASK